MTVNVITMILSRILFGLLLFLPASWTQISERNKAIAQAERLYTEAKYEESVRQHLELVGTHGLDNEEVRFNLALSYHYNGQEAEAQKGYAALLGASQITIASNAANQSGVIDAEEKKYKEALASFKLALLKDPSNESARYNYELLSRWLADNEEEKEEQEQQEEDRMQPSNYAKRMKAQADALVDQFRFGEALDVMSKALEIDETVSYYDEFIKHLGDIHEINEN